MIVYDEAATLPSTLMVTVDDPEPPDMAEVLNELVGPVGDDVADRMTVPENPLRGATVTVAVAELPAWIESEVGLAVIVKFGVDELIVNSAV